MRCDSSRSTFRPAVASWPAAPPSSFTGLDSVTVMPTWRRISPTGPASPPRSGPRIGSAASPWWMPLLSMVTGTPRIDAPATVVPPLSLVSPPSEVAVRSVVIESITRSPSTLKPLVWVRACTVTVEPSVSVVAVAVTVPNVATAGASTAGSVAWARDPRVGDVDPRRRGPGPGSPPRSGCRSPTSPRCGTGRAGACRRGTAADASDSTTSGLASRSPGSATEARAKVDGPLAIVARASGIPRSTGGGVGRMLPRL